MICCTLEDVWYATYVDDMTRMPNMYHLGSPAVARPTFDVPALVNHLRSNSTRVCHAR